MSKYTTEVRYICEHLSGLDESKGYHDVATIIANSRRKVFDFPYPIFDENYREVLETKILKHFYTREIGDETVGLWKLRLDMKLNEIMPYYNKLYKAEVDDLNPFYSTDLRVERQTVGVSNRKTGETIDDKNNAIGSNHFETGGTTESKVTNRGLQDNGDVYKGKQMDLYSETPQGSLSGIDADVPTYLTNARKNESDTIDNSHTHSIDVGENTTTTDKSDNSTSFNSNEYNRNRDMNEDANSTERFVERTYGYNGYLPSEILKKLREVIWNIDMMIIEDLEPLFMQLW